MKLSNFRLTIVFFILSCLIIYYIKPKCIFNDDNTFKQFGLSSDKTPIPFWLLTISLSILVYILLIINRENYIE